MCTGTLIVLAWSAIDLVIACHDRQRLGLFDHDFKIPQIDFPQRPLGDAGIVSVAVRLLVVAGEMLGTGGLSLALYAAHHCRRHLAGEQRVLGKVLEIAAAEGIAVDVHARGKLHVYAVMDHFLAHLGREGRGVPQGISAQSFFRRRHAGQSDVMIGGPPFSRRLSITPPKVPALPATPRVLPIMP